MTACDLDGATRYIIARDETGVWWHCPFCKQDGREQYDPPTLRAMLQREWDQ